MIAFEDPKNPGNGPAYHTGKPCCEKGCDNPAGTAWSPHWCFECNVKRIRRIDRQLNAVLENFGERKREALEDKP